MENTDEFKQWQSTADCVAGCKALSYNETKHHPDCPCYPDSLSKLLDKASQTPILTFSGVVEKGYWLSSKGMMLIEEGDHKLTPGQTVTVQVWEDNNESIR